MTSKIKNKIDEAGLMILDLKDFEVKGRRASLDLATWLDNDFIIRESLFKKQLESVNWLEMKNTFVAVFCSKDVIIPPWSYLLIQSKLVGVARQVFFSDLHTMNLLLFQKEIEKLSLTKFKNRRVFLKICSGNTVPIEAISMCAHRLMPVVKSLFYGEPCSSIPLIKN